MSKYNNFLLYANVVCAALNLASVVTGHINFLTVIALLFNCVAVKVLLDAKKRSSS